MIRFQCPTCQAHLQHPKPDEKVACPQCGQRIRVPRPSLPASHNPTVLGQLPTEVPPGATPGPVPPPRAIPLTSPPAAIPISSGPGSSGDQEQELPQALPADGEGRRDTKHCYECGAVIRAKAEVCPRCGVGQPPVDGRAERFPGEAHNGIPILVLGALSLFVMPLPLGLVAWLWGNQDLRKMDAGEMDPEGRGMTQAGRICGMISTVVACCILGLVLLYLLLYFVAVFFLCGLGGAASVGGTGEPLPLYILIICWVVVLLGGGVLVYWLISLIVSLVKHLVKHLVSDSQPPPKGSDPT
jgi:DNA-directed RNA polymerase subunit RPC12/RpoP